MELMEKNRELLGGLQAQVEVIRQGLKTPEGFYQLGKSMEAYRDFVRDHLDTLPTTRERSAAEDQLSPAIHTLVDVADKLAEEAHKAGIINEGLAYDIGMLGISLTFVSGFTKLVREAPEHIKPRRRR